MDEFDVFTFNFFITKSEVLQLNFLTFFLKINLTLLLFKSY